MRTGNNSSTPLHNLLTILWAIQQTTCCVLWGFCLPLREISCGNKHNLKADSHKSSMLKPPCMYLLHHHYLHQGACAYVCWLLCLRDRQQDYAKTTRWISTKVVGRMTQEQRKSPSSFGTDWDKGDVPKNAYLSVYYYNSGYLSTFLLIFFRISG